MRKASSVVTIGILAYVVLGISCMFRTSLVSHSAVASLQIKARQALRSEPLEAKTVHVLWAQHRNNLDFVIASYQTSLVTNSSASAYSLLSKPRLVAMIGDDNGGQAQSWGAIGSSWLPQSIAKRQTPLGHPVNIEMDDYALLGGVVTSRAIRLVQFEFSKSPTLTAHLNSNGSYAIILHSSTAPKWHTMRGYSSTGDLIATEQAP